MGKPRVNLRLSWKLHAELERRASGEGVTKTQIVEDALGRFFDPEANLVLEERLLRRMDAFDRRQGEIEAPDELLETDRPADVGAEGKSDGAFDVSHWGSFLWPGIRGRAAWRDGAYSYTNHMGPG